MKSEHQLRDWTIGMMRQQDAAVEEIKRLEAENAELRRKLDGYVRDSKGA